jgi:chaperone required for assembly of F1-ATPase
LTDASALARRFYKETSVADLGEGFGVKLDARTLKTPGGLTFVAPTRTLAELCAREWDAQREHIHPASMPISQFAFATLDWTAKKRADLTRYVSAFGETDLCCHRAESPSELVERQSRLWDPIVAWADEALGVRLPVVAGVIAAPVEPEVLQTIEARAAAYDDFRLTALAQTTGLAGSVLIGFAVLEGRLTAQQAFEAAALDNLWSLEKWGEDAEGRARLDRQRAEFEALERFIGALA